MIDEFPSHSDSGMLFRTRHMFVRAVLLTDCTSPLVARMLHVPVRSQHCSSIQKQATVAKQIFQAAIDAVLPTKMVMKHLRVQGNRLSVNGESYPLKRNVYVAAFGKAVSGMASAAEDVLGDHLVAGVASVPAGMKDALKNAGRSDMWPSSGKIEVIEGAINNVPDENAMRAALKVKQLAESLTQEDILLVLISGGGSALLSAPLPPVTLEEKKTLTKLLSKRGASIHELNAIRSKISLLKGGKLAALASTSQIIALILSDVIGDPLDIIASGPTIVPSQTTSERCLEILGKYTTPGEVADNVINVLSRPESGPTGLEHVNNVIVGNNAAAVENSELTAEDLGYTPVVLSTSISGEARVIGRRFADLAESCSKLYGIGDEASSEASVLSNLLRSFDTPDEARTRILSLIKRRKQLCLIGAGETTVTLRGDGKGGRNQEMVLSWATAAANKDVPEVQVTFLSGGTDGQDGPTDAAGAWAYPRLSCDVMASDGLDAVKSLNCNDSYTFFTKFQNGSNLVKTGLTGTNVMDIHVLLFKPP